MLDKRLIPSVHGHLVRDPAHHLAYLVHGGHLVNVSAHRLARPVHGGHLLNVPAHSLARLSVQGHSLANVPAQSRARSPSHSGRCLSTQVYVFYALFVAVPSAVLVCLYSGWQ